MSNGSTRKNVLLTITDAAYELVDVWMFSQGETPYIRRDVANGLELMPATPF
jgi:hypothetical protein